MKKRTKGFIAIGVSIILIILIIDLYIGSKPFRYAGTLEATKIDLSARQNAAITNVNVWEGDKVTEDQVLITLACEDFRHAAQLANKTYSRYDKLINPGWTTPENMDELKKQKLDADTFVDWCTLKSPINGRVLTRYHEPGEWMLNGTKILTIANIKDIWAYIYVPQPMIANLSYGMTLKAYLPELNDRVFEGKIIKISDEAEFTPKNVQTQKERERLIYGIKISFLGVNEDEILKPGMTVEVELPKKSKNQNIEAKDQNKEAKNQNIEAKNQNKEIKDQNIEAKDQNKEVKDQNIEAKLND